MQVYNLIAVFDFSCEKLLMCERKKDPYIGLFNFVGGKKEEHEHSDEAAYRELFEETAIKKEDIALTHLMDFVYYLGDCKVEVYAGRLNRTLSIFGDENKLYWSGIDCDFFDMSKYAGEGNIGHIMEQIKIYREHIFK
ncbi:NUDIX hydrolase [Anaeropeptidivorans aminofermentans]|uniref:NUDIX hydrolase n=1 Tax=Anaeropeptidivorans aminofermentans TaxID=2934315 RepID=UPI0020245160|nr:NUDIX domain-containing protein [Anaeropeptidivorans aminofermentans]MBE6013399.1 NUDIX hydrolase [Lachnospiraceae bacterium]